MVLKIADIELWSQVYGKNTGPQAVALTSSNYECCNSTEIKTNAAFIYHYTLYAQPLVSYDKTMDYISGEAAPFRKQDIILAGVDDAVVMGRFCISGRGLRDLFSLSENHACRQFAAEQDGDHGKRKSR